MNAEELILDGSKVQHYQDRIEAWQRGERIAPVTIDVSWTRRCQAACIGPDEPVLLADGRTKRMADITFGDRVLSFADGRIEVSTVLSSWLTHKQADIISIVTGGQKLRCTVDHRILTREGWREAGTLHIGDEIIAYQEAAQTDFRFRQTVEGQEAWSHVRGAEADSERKEQGILERPQSRAIEEACWTADGSLQPRSGENQGETVSRIPNSSWGAVGEYQQNPRAVGEGTTRSVQADEAEGQVRTMQARSTDRRRKGTAPPTDARQQDRRWSNMQREEQTSIQQTNEEKQSDEGPGSSQEDGRDSRGEVRQRRLQQDVEASLGGREGAYPRGVLRRRAGSHQRADEEEQSNEEQGGGRESSQDQSGTGSLRKGIRKDETELAGRKDRSFDIRGQRSGETSEQDRVSGVTLVGIAGREIRGRREILDQEYEERDLSKPRLHLRQWQDQASLIGSWGLLASGRGAGEEGTQGLSESWLERDGFVDKEDQFLDASEHSGMGRIVVERVQAIEAAGTSPVYDLECYPHHNFIASGIVVHNCSFCYAQMQAAEDRTVISRDNAFDFLQDAAEIGVKGVSLISDGESTLVPWYAESVEWGAKHGLAIGAGSNGIALRRPVLERILPHLSYLRFNFSAGERQRYAQIMGVNQHFYDGVVQNIRDGMEIINRDRLKCSLNMQLVCDPRDGDQIIPFAKLVCELRPVYGIIKHCADNAEGQLGVDYSKYAALEDDFRQAEEMGKEAGVRIVVKWSRLEGKRTYSRCLGPPFIMQVSGNGNVSSCGFHFNEKYRKFIIGSICKQRFRDIWASDRYWEVMRYLASDHFNPQDRCGPNCLQTKTNEWLFDYVNGRVSLPLAGSEKPPDLEFL